METKYDTYYTQLNKELDEIINEESFQGTGASSKAFGFWYLKNELKLVNNDINEILIDGSNDQGVDAYYLDEEKHILNIYQFKLPEKGNFKKEIDQSAITKVYLTINNLINNPSSRVNNMNNEGFKNLTDLVKNSKIYGINIVFVSFNLGIKAVDSLNIIANQEAYLNPDIEFTHEIVNRDKIINLYDRLHRNNSLNLTFEYKNLQPSNSVSETNGDTAIESWVGVINAVQLVKAIGDNLSSIFDENIRLYENKSRINEGIKSTARDARTANMFYFYNNGITLICDDAKNSPGSNNIALSGVSIVNGAQTVNSLANLYDTDSLQKEVAVLIRIIKIKNYEQRAKITEYLNSQTPIKESYFIANNSIIRALQEEMFQFEYYLERQINEYSYKDKYQDMSAFKGYQILPVADAVQHYVGAYVNHKAAQAKSGKSVLFNQNSIEDNIKDISAKKVIDSDKVYRKIASVITKYRRNRRNINNHEFSDYLDIPKETYNSDLYSFLNTGDILMLNTVTNIQNVNNKLNTDDAIKQAIALIKDTIAQSNDLNSQAPATLTKSNKLFEKIQESVNSNKN